ncbi:hypothetical protein SprV_0200850700 [Sparganum proliferum]
MNRLIRILRVGVRAHLLSVNSVNFSSKPQQKSVAVVFHGCGVYDGTEIHEATRNVLVESARLSRGKILPLKSLIPSEFDALLIPGGFGVATTLSDFAASGASCKILLDLEKVISEFHKTKKPIGLCCIAPVLAARCLPGVKITLGKETDEGGRWQNCGACSAVKDMGARHEPRDITEVCVDDENKVVTAPAYMCSTAEIGEVFDNIGLLVKRVLSMIPK